MFQTLLSSGATPPLSARTPIAAVLLHLIIILSAVRLTASGPESFVPVLPDTLRLQLYQPDRREPAREQLSDPSPLPPHLPPIPPLAGAPPIDLSFNPGPSERNQLDIPGLTGTTPSHSTAEPLSLSNDPDQLVSDVDELPQLRSLTPDYPDALQRAGVSGEVLIQYVVLPTGRADSASVRVIASTDPAFTKSVITSVLGASFKAARRQGVPVPVLVRQTIRFQKR